MSNINWFPGHMTKTIRQIETIIKVVDVVIEVIDARIVESSLNPLVPKLINNKKSIIIVNKIDLADDMITNKWYKILSNKYDTVILMDAKKTNIKTLLITKINKTLEEKIKKYNSKGLVNYQIRAMIIGIPNVGKSTIINSLSKNKKVKVGNKPGVTRGQQWIIIDKNIYLLDTPGILWPKLDGKNTAKNLAITGCIKPEILDKEEIVNYGIYFLFENYPELLKKLDKNELPPKDFFKEKEIHKYIEILKKRYKLNNNKIINKIFYDLINNKYGKISWEAPNDEK